METIVGLFQDYDDADRALDALEDAGFVRDALSVVAPQSVVEVEELDEDDHVDAAEGAAFGAAEGGIIGGLAGLLAGMGVIAIPGIGPIIAAGSLATALVSAVGGAVVGAGSGALTGGLAGALMDAGISQEEAHTYAEGVRQGNVLVTVRADGFYVGIAKNIMRQAGAINVDEAREAWTDEGIAVVPPTRFPNQ